MVRFFQSRDSIITVGLITLQALLVCSLESYVVYQHLGLVSNCSLTTVGEGISTSDLIYHGLFMAAQIFQIILALDALHQRNTAQLYALVLFDLLVIVYGAIQLEQHIILEDVGCGSDRWAPVNPGEFTGIDQAKAYYESKMRPVEYTIIALIPIFFLVLSWFAYRLNKTFAWGKHVLHFGSFVFLFHLGFFLKKKKIRNREQSLPDNCDKLRSRSETFHRIASLTILFCLSPPI